MKKILIVRFSSIGDIVLTTPVIRCLKQQLPDCEIHYVTKVQFHNLIATNPYLTKIHTFEKNLSEVSESLKAERFDLVVDLHNNLRSIILKQKLGARSVSVKKQNFKKWRYVKFKIKPDISHIVMRYIETVKKYKVKYDGAGLDYFIPEKEEVDVYKHLNVTAPFITIATGAKYFTKQIPENKIQEILNELKLPVVFLGGKEDMEKARSIISNHKGSIKLVNACGKFSLNQSASVIKQSEGLITGDTGLMHIATALDKNIISLWGNTTPEIGFSPWFKEDSSALNIMLENKNLNCRPCSKLGYNRCPQGHFKCMNDLEIPQLAQFFKSE